MTASDRLDEIEARANAATDGPWDEYDAQIRHTQIDGFTRPDERAAAQRQTAADIDFVMHARNDVPALVAALRAVLDVCEKSELGAYPEPTYDEYIPGQLDTAERVREAITAALNDN